MFVTGNSVNVRSENNSNSSIISKLNQNEKVEVLEVNGDWAKIEFNGQNGYINQKFLSENKIETTNKDNKSFSDYLKMFGIGILLILGLYISHKYKKPLL